MPLDEQSKIASLKAAGLSPDEWDVDEQGVVTQKPTNLQPSINPKPTLPSLTPPTSSALGAFGRQAGASVIPTAAGLAGGMATGAGLGAVLTGPFAPAGALIGGIAGGIGASYGASKLQEAVLPDSINQQLAQDQQEHPVASFMGGLAPSAVAFNPIQGIKSLPNVARGLGKMATLNGEALTLGEKAAAMNAAINTGVNAGQNIYDQSQSDQPFSIPSLLANAGVGAIMNEPRSFMKPLGFHSSADIDAALRAQREAAVAQQSQAQAQAPFVEPKMSPVDFANAQGGDYRNLTLPTPGKLATADRRIPNAMKDYKSGEPLVPEEVLNNLEGEGGIPQQPKVNPLNDIITSHIESMGELEKMKTERMKIETELEKERRLTLEARQKMAENAPLVSDAGTGDSTKPAQVFNQIQNPPAPEPNPTLAITRDDRSRQTPSTISEVVQPTLKQQYDAAVQAGDTIKQRYLINKNGSDFYPERRMPAVRTKDGLRYYGNAENRTMEEAIRLAKEDGISEDKLEAGTIRENADSHHDFRPDKYQNTSELDTKNWEQLPPEFKQQVRDLATRRGITLTEASKLIRPDTGTEVAGKLNLPIREATVNTSKAMGDTGPHEVAHGFINDLVNSTSPTDRALAERGLKIFGGDSNHAEEALVSRLGVEGHERIKGQLEGSALRQFESWYKDLKSRVKTKLGVGSDEDVVRHISQRLQTDAEHGMRGEVDYNKPRYVGYQEGFGNIKGKKLYNLQNDVEDKDKGTKYVKGSTVSEDTLNRLGIKYQDESALKGKDFSTSLEKELEKPTPFNLTMSPKDNTISRQSLEARMKQRLGKSEMASLKDSGLDNFLATQGDRVNTEKMKQWLSENGPKVEVKKFTDRSGIGPAEQRQRAIVHELDTLGFDMEHEVTSPDYVYQRGRGEVRLDDIPEQARKLIKEHEGLQPIVSGEYSDRRQNKANWSQVSPKPENQMKGYTEIAVVKPKLRELTGDDEIHSQKQADKLEGIKFPSSHNFPPNTLAWVRGHMEDVWRNTDTGKYSKGEKPINGNWIPEKHFLIHELQSDWAQKRRSAEQPFDKIAKFNWDRGNPEHLPSGWKWHEEKHSLGTTYILQSDDRSLGTVYRSNLNQKSKLAAFHDFIDKDVPAYSKYEHLNGPATDPLLSHYESLALKAAIDHARSEGATHIAMSDAETAMLTEGHDRAAEHRRIEFGMNELPKAKQWEAADPSNRSLRANDKGFTGIDKSVKEVSQEKGMRLHYDVTSPNILEKLTGSKGVRSEYGEHKMAVDRTYRPERYNEATGQVEGGHITQVNPRKDLIFKNPDGTPKTSITARAYPIDEVASRRETGEPFSLHGTRYQEESPLASGKTPDAIKLGQRDNSKTEGAPDEKSSNTGNALDYKTFAPTRSLLDSVRFKMGEVGKKFADAAAKAFEEKQSLRAKYMNPIDEVIGKGKLSVEEKNKLENVLVAENRAKQSYRDTLPTKLQPVYDAVRSSLLQKQNDQIKDKQPVNETRPDGSTFAREAKIDPYYYPNMANPKVIKELVSNPDSGQSTGLKKDFLNHQLAMGLNQEQAQSKLDNYLQSLSPASKMGIIDKHGSNNYFKAVREAQGVGLPDSWMQYGLDKNLNRYFTRVANDRSFFRNIENNPDVAKSLGMTKDAWGKPIQSDSKTIGGTDVNAVLDSLVGEHHTEDESNVKGINKVATSLMLGPLTNAHILVSSIANGISNLKGGQVVAGVTHALTHFNDSIKHALETGYKRKDYSSVKDILDSNLTFSQRMSSLADTISNLSGRKLTDTVSKGLLQGLGEHFVDTNLELAKQGNADAIFKLKQLDPTVRDWRSASENMTGKEKIQLASNFASMIHGAHDPRSMPKWILHDSAIQPFFALASWNIGQTNNFMRNVYTPALKGNFEPLIMATLGAGLGGALLKELREKLSDKKAAIPSLTELHNSSKGLSGNIPLAAYNMMAMTSMAGYGGILSMLGKTGFDVAYKNVASAPAFPLDEVLSGATKTSLHAVQAIMNAQSPEEYYQIGLRASIDLARENVQLARLAHSWAVEIPGVSAEGALMKHEGEAKKELRNYKMAEGMPVEAQSASDSNPYLDLPYKQFKREGDLTEAMKDLPTVLHRAMDRAGNNPEVLKSEFQKIKANNYETLPSPDNMPMTFINYYNYLRRVKGDDKAKEILMDYLKRNAINHAKSEMIPTM